MAPRPAPRSGCLGQPALFVTIRISLMAPRPAPRSGYLGQPALFVTIDRERAVIGRILHALPTQTDIIVTLIYMTSGCP